MGTGRTPEVVHDEFRDKDETQPADDLDIESSADDVKDVDPNTDCIQDSNLPPPSPDLNTPETPRGIRLIKRLPKSRIDRSMHIVMKEHEQFVKRHGTELRHARKMEQAASLGTIPNAATLNNPRVDLATPILKLGQAVSGSPWRLERNPLSNLPVFPGRVFMKSTRNIFERLGSGTSAFVKPTNDLRVTLDQYDKLAESLVPINYIEPIWRFSEAVLGDSWSRIESLAIGDQIRQCLMPLEEGLFNDLLKKRDALSAVWGDFDRINQAPLHQAHDDRTIEGWASVVRGFSARPSACYDHPHNRQSNPAIIPEALNSGARGHLWPSRDRIHVVSDLSVDCGLSTDSLVILDRGQVCEIRWRGENVLCRNLLGFKILKILVEHHGTCFGVEELWALARGVSQDQANLSDQESEGLFARRGQVESQAAADDPCFVSDDKAILNYKNRLRDIAGDMEEAMRNHDLAKKQRLSEEREFILSCIPRQEGGRSAFHSHSDQEEKARKNVSKLIETALRELRRESPAIEKHIRDHIKRGYRCRYFKTSPHN